MWVKRSQWPGWALAALLAAALTATCLVLAGCKGGPQVSESEGLQCIVLQNQRIEKYINDMPSSSEKDSLMQAWKAGKVAVSSGELTKYMQQQGRTVWFYSDDIVIIREDVLPCLSSSER